MNQLDGNMSFENLDEEDCDEKYFNTENYWKRGYLGRIYQSYIDALHILEESELDEKEKEAVEQNTLLDMLEEELQNDG